MPLETIPALKTSNPLSQSPRSRHGAVKPIATLRSPTLCLKVEGSPLNFIPIWLQFTVCGDGSCAQMVIVSSRERWPCTEQTYSIRYRTLLFICITSKRMQ